MSRHGFRSQPALQRSRPMPSLSLFGLGGLIALGLGFGALVTALQERPAHGVQTYGASALAPAGPADSVATSPAPPPASAAVAPAQAPPQPGPAAAVAVASLQPKPAARPHAPRAARSAHAPAAAAPSPQAAWEQQRQAYERAMAAYDANEKAEGWRWAQQNHLRSDRYCRGAGGRTPAFLDGCLGFVRGAAAPDRAG